MPELRWGPGSQGSLLGLRLGPEPPSSCAGPGGTSAPILERTPLEVLGRGSPQPSKVKRLPDPPLMGPLTLQGPRPARAVPRFHAAHPGPWRPGRATSWGAALVLQRGRGWSHMRGGGRSCPASRFSIPTAVPLPRLRGTRGLKAETGYLAREAVLMMLPEATLARCPPGL